MFLILIAGQRLPDFGVTIESPWTNIITLLSPTHFKYNNVSLFCFISCHSLDLGAPVIDVIPLLKILVGA